MNETLKCILSLSVSASCIGIILLILKPLYKDKFTKSWQYYIWLVILARLLIPYSPTVHLPDTWKIQIPAMEESENITEYTEAKTPSVSATSDVPQIIKPHVPSDLYESKTETKQPLTAAPLKNAMRFLSQYVWLCWLAIGLLLFVIKTAVYYNYARQVKKTAVKITDECSLFIYFTACSSMKVKHAPRLFLGDVTSPMLIGVIRPLIILPLGFSWSDKALDLILKHELMHYKRNDIMLKWILQITACIHWFNPFVYIFKNEINKNCELSCDEAVLNTMQNEDYRSYGDALLSNIIANKKKSPATAFLSSEGKLLKKRLEAIMNKTKNTKKYIVVSLALTVTLLTCAMLTGNLFVSANTTTSDEKLLAPVAKENTQINAIDVLPNEPIEAQDNTKDISNAPLPFETYEFDSLCFPVAIRLLNENEPQRWNICGIELDSPIPHLYADTNALKKGDDVYAVYDGVVTNVSTDNDGRNIIKIDHGQGFVSEYIFVENAKVKDGETVKTGQPIACISKNIEAHSGTIAGFAYSLEKDGEYYDNSPRSRMTNTCTDGQNYLVIEDTGEIVAEYVFNDDGSPKEIIFRNGMENLYRVPSFIHAWQQYAFAKVN